MLVLAAVEFISLIVMLCNFVMVNIFVDMLDYDLVFRGVIVMPIIMACLWIIVAMTGGVITVILVRSMVPCRIRRVYANVY